MKKMLLMMMLLIGVSGFSQEKREYTEINENEVNVKVYQNDKLIQQGNMLNYNDKWVNDGIWRQYNQIGLVDLTVLYNKGRKINVSKVYNDYLLVVNTRGVR